MPDEAAPAPDDIGQIIADAAAKHAEIARITAELDALKVQIRAAALEQASKGGVDPKDGGKVELASPAGVCTVVFIRDKFELAKRATAERVKAVLPAESWAALFELRPALRADAGACFAELSKADRDALAALVQFSPMDPRVTLPKL